MLLSLTVTAAAAAQHASAAPKGNTRTPREAKLGAAVDSFVSVRVASGAFSGVVALAHGTRPVYERAAGVANRETNLPMRLDTKLQIASMTKLFTQIAIYQLVEQRKLSLHDTLGTFLPTYHNAVARNQVTVEQLLSHRSGIGSFWNARFMAHPERVRTVADYIDLFQDDSLLFPPGTSEAYSNGGYVLLGAIIEKVSGQPYQDYVRDHVFRPAGMTNTVPFDRKRPLLNAAVGYTAQPAGPVMGDPRLAGGGSPPPGAHLRLIGPDGRDLKADEVKKAMAGHRADAEPTHSNLAMQPGVSGPAGDHYSTVGDLIALAHALVNHRLLDAEHTAAVLGPRYASGEDFRIAGGGPGVNAEFSIFPSGDVIVVLSNDDPPAATDVAQFIRQQMSPGR